MVIIGCKIGSVDNKTIGFTIGIVDEINFGINKSTYVGSLIGTSEIYIDGYIYDEIIEFTIGTSDGIKIGLNEMTYMGYLIG